MKLKWSNFYLFFFIFEIVMSFNTLIAEESDPVVVKVNQYEFRLSYIQEKAESLQVRDQLDREKQFDQIVNSVIQEEIFCNL